MVIDLHRKTRDVYGIRKMWHSMTQAGHQVGRDHVARLAIAGVHGVSRGQHTTTSTTHRDGVGFRMAARAFASRFIGRRWRCRSLI